MINLQKILLLSTFPISLLLFLPSLNYYFFQDDWFVLNWVRTHDFLSFFAFRTDIIYWRPLSMPLFFFTLDKFFPMNPSAFHMVTFLIFLLLIISVYKLFLILLKEPRPASLAAFLYGTWPIHYISLSWSSTASYIVGPLFEVLSLLFFIEFVNKRKIRNYFVSFLFFLLAIASSEFALVLPLLFLTYGYFFKKLIQTKLIIPYLFLDLLYLFSRFYLFPIPAKGDYAVAFNFKLINNFVWYILWGLGVPERFKYLIFPDLPIQSLKVLSQFYQVTLPAILLFLVILLKAKYVKNNLNKFFFGILWLVIGLMPVIFLANHSYPVYLSFAGIGIIFIIVSVSNKANNYYLACLMIMWLLVSFATLNFTRNDHWIRNEQAASKAYVNYALKRVKNPPNNSVFVFKPANLNFSRNHDFVIVEGEDTIKTSLSDQNALQVIFNDTSLKSVFITHQEKLNLPRNIPVFEISPAE